MSTLFHFIRLAVQNLLRGGQRMLVALLCITFGVMALVAMTMLANSLETVIKRAPDQIVGGDLSLVRKTEDTIGPEDANQLTALQQSGAIRRYTLIAYTSTIMFHVSGSGEMHFAGNGMGVETDKYPLAGSLTIGEPGSTGLPTLLQQVGDTVITRDIAEAYSLRPGDRIILADPMIGVPVEGTIRGIAYDTPNHQGDKIYYSIETAEKLAGGRTAVNTAIVSTSEMETVATQLGSSGWSVTWVADQTNTNAANAWILGLRGVGILGLLVSGIGIANTMQVLLRRRQREIAIWKTLGYQASDLRLIFSLEAGLLGFVGSLIGSGLGVMISTGLLEIFRRASIMLYQWTFSPTPPLSGILVGTLSTVIFAYWSIAISSQARPISLLRSERIETRSLLGCQSIALGLLLAVLFTILATLMMESVLAGFGILMLLALGVAILGGFFNGLLWVCTHLLPLDRFRMAGIAFRNLRRRSLALIFAMVALFVGVLSMGLGALVALKSIGGIPSLGADGQSYNLTILASADQENAIRHAVEAQNPKKTALGYRTALADLTTGNGDPVNGMDAVLIGRSDPADYIINGAAWGSQPDGVYAYSRAHLEPGSQVEITFRDGAHKTLTVIGTYDVNLRSDALYPPTGLLLMTSEFTQIAQPDSLTWFVQVETARLDRVVSALGANLPGATVIDLVAYAGRFMASYQRLYFLPLAMAGLALLAGLLLVANSVGLAMLERRHEIGILKTVGYSRWQVLTIFVIEYGLAGALASGMAAIVILGGMVLMSIASQTPVVGITLVSIPPLALAALCGTGVTLLTVAGVTWEPTHASPVSVLNEQG